MSDRPLRHLSNYFDEYPSMLDAWEMATCYEDYTAVNKALCRVRLNNTNTPVRILQAYEHYEYIKEQIRKEYGR